MELNHVSCMYPRVFDTTDWLELEKYKELEDGLGVFILSNFFFQVQYIGRAGEKGIVSGISDAIKSGKSAGATKIKVLYTRSEKQAIQLEKDLIVKYHPVKNLK